MEEKKRKKKNDILRKTWERCRSFGNLQSPPSINSNTNSSSSNSNSVMVKRSKSWSNLSTAKRVGLSTPHGCFSVYVGPDKQRFVMKVECTKHPLFKKLLEEAEMEYGYHSDGPLLFPCDVHSFIKVLVQMDLHAHPHPHPHHLTSTTSTFP